MARSVKGYDADYGIFLIDEKPVRGDMTFPVAVVIAMKIMVTIFLR